MKFTHLHVHTHYSLLDGMSKVPDLIKKCVATGMNSVAITDHGNMFGIKEFLDTASKHNGGVKKNIKIIEGKLVSEGLSEDERNSLLAELVTAKSQMFKPIVGVEAYCARTSLHSKKELEDRSGWHLVLLAKNKKGYQNLCKLVSASWIDGYYYRPRIDKELLEQYHEGLIVSSACLGGEVSQKILKNDLAAAEETIHWFKKLFGEDFYLEIQRHQTNDPNANCEVYIDQQRVNEHILALGAKTNTKVIATNDVHFVEQIHAEAHDRLICLSTGKDLADPNRMRYTKQEWLKTPQEMEAIFADVPEVLSNTQDIADKVELFSIDSGPLMPMFEIPADFGTEEQYRAKYTEEDLFNEFTQDEKGNVVVTREQGEEKIKKLGGYDKLYRIKLEADYLAQIAWKGAEHRYPDLTDDIKERIVFELYIMKTMGFPGYFLIVQDFIQAARDMGVSVGPGRGSAAGSVVAYCLKITDIDPLKYDLLFERFLNPDRISLPDIDIDFDDDGRGEVLRWVTHKYGKEKVAHIVTYGTMATKSSIADVGRVQKVPLPEVNAIKGFIPDKFDDSLADKKGGKAPKVNITNCIKHVPEIKDARYGQDPNVSDMLKYAEMLEGTVRQTGVHACGVIIGADDLTNHVPLSTAKDKVTNQDLLVTQYEGSVIETVGLIKMDFLGLKTLSIIKEALRNIKKSKGIDLDIDKIPIDDVQTYELYSRGQTTGTFQFESAGMQKHLKSLRPTTFEDLIAMNALYRPGPMQYIPQFIARKHGEEPIVYDLPVMEMYLKDTYGITVYQEQVMLLSRLLADFTRGESDNLRKAMGKKMKDKLDHMKPDFIERGKKNGHDPKILDKIWTDWEAFASYAFNKSHAACYSWIAYQTAYLKAHYPAEFMAANLTRNRDDIKEVGKFMDDCKLVGISVLGPDVNESDLNFTANANGDIRFGLGGIKGVGQAAVEALVAEREKNGKFTSIFNFIERVNLNACNKKTVESLILSGALDCFPETYREQFMTTNSKDEPVLDTLMRYGNRYQAASAMATNSLFGGFDSVEIAKPELPKPLQWTPLERLNREKSLIGMYLSAHPLDEFEFEINHVCNTVTTDLQNIPLLRGKNLKIGGMISAIRNGMSQAGNPYAIFTLEDYAGSHEFALFGKNFLEFGNFVVKDMYVMINAIVQPKGADYRRRNDPPINESEVREWEIKIQKITPISEVREKQVNKITLQIPIGEVTIDLVHELEAKLKESRGNTPLYITVYDPSKQNIITFVSKSYRVSMTKTLYAYLKEKRTAEVMSFKTN